MKCEPIKCKSDGKLYYSNWFGTLNRSQEKLLKHNRKMLEEHGFYIYDLMDLSGTDYMLVYGNVYVNHIGTYITNIDLRPYMNCYGAYGEISSYMLEQYAMAKECLSLEDIMNLIKKEGEILC